MAWSICFTCLIDFHAILYRYILYMFRKCINHENVVGLFWKFAAVRAKYSGHLHRKAYNCKLANISFRSYWQVTTLLLSQESFFGMVCRREQKQIRELLFIQLKKKKTILTKKKAQWKATKGDRDFSLSPLWDEMKLSLMLYRFIAFVSLVLLLGSRC